MKLNIRVSLVVAGIWFLLVGLRGLGVFDIGMANDMILPFIALVTGVLLVVSSIIGVE